MAVDGIINGRCHGKRDKSRLVSNIFNPTVENEQSEAGWDGWTRLAKPYSQAQTETGKISFALLFS